MIRTAERSDMADILELAEATGMFEAEELGSLGELVAVYFEGALGPDHVWLVDHENGLKAAAYYAREEMGDGVWNLYFIGVHAAARGQGRASKLIQAVEESVAAKAARILIVETSGQDAFAPARALYAKLGFDAEGRIRDYYRDGDDKCIFRKRVSDV